MAHESVKGMKLGPWMCQGTDERPTVTDGRQVTMAGRSDARWACVAHLFSQQDLDEQPDQREALYQMAADDEVTSLVAAYAFAMAEHHGEADKLQAAIEEDQSIMAGPDASEAPEPTKVTCKMDNVDLFPELYAKGFAESFTKPRFAVPSPPNEPRDPWEPLRGGVVGIETSMSGAKVRCAGEVPGRPGQTWESTFMAPIARWKVGDKVALSWVTGKPNGLLVPEPKLEEQPPPPPDVCSYADRVPIKIDDADVRVFVPLSQRPQFEKARGNEPQDVKDAACRQVEEARADLMAQLRDEARARIARLLEWPFCGHTQRTVSIEWVDDQAFWVCEHCRRSAGKDLVITYD